MGKIKQGILGGFSGKVGSTIGSSWKGLAIMKSMPLSVAQPLTHKKEYAKGIFGWVVSYAKPINSDVLKKLLNSNGQRMSAFNRFIQLNRNNFNYSGILPETPLIISQGNLSIKDIGLSAIRQDESTLIATWVDNSHLGLGNPDDKIFGIILSDYHLTSAPILNSAIRSDQTMVIHLPSNWIQTDEFILCMAFTTENGLIKSDTFSYIITD
jgi:hypothetical protein